MWSLCQLQQENAGRMKYAPVFSMAHFQAHYFVPNGNMRMRTVKLPQMKGTQKYYRVAPIINVRPCMLYYSMDLAYIIIERAQS